MPSLARDLVLALPALVLGFGCSGDPSGPNGDGNGGNDTGSITVSVTTTGAAPDPDGYTATIGSTSQTVAVNGSVTFSGLSPGAKSVRLSGLAANCSAQGDNPRDVTVAANQTATASFDVSCPATGLSAITLEGIDQLEEALFNALTGLDTLSDLDDFSFEDARATFEEALAADPDDETAMLGLAVTTIFVLEDDPDIRAAAEQWDAWLQTHELDDIRQAAVFAPAAPFFWDRASLPLDLTGQTIRRVASANLVRQLLEPAASDGTYPPTPAEHQVLLDQVVAPALETAAEALRGIDDPDFVFEITERMQGENPGEAEILELDLTEVLAIRATLEAALATVDMALAYVLDPAPYGADGFVTALTPGSTFGTLAAGGETRMASALDHLRAAVDILQNGVDVLAAESDDQSNDIIKRDPSGFDGLSDSDLQEVRDVLTDVESALLGPTSVTQDLGDGDVTVTVDLTQLFLNPIEDVKAVLPDYEVFAATTPELETEGTLRFTALNLVDWVFPDPTFNGVLPEIGTSADLVSTFDLDEVYFDIGSPSTGYFQLITIDAVDCDAVTMQGGLGCDVGAFYVQGASLSLWGYDQEPMASLYLSTVEDTNMDGIGDVFGSFYYTGPYTAAPGAGDEITVTMSLTEWATGEFLALTATLVDELGFTGRDGFGRARGGTSVSFALLGAQWSMERQ